ncbi:hypothetical protein V3851_26460 [Paenibacillus sp. M1]|uniref:Uncharacterized protein n=2 Tax=Paenibacillus TaxID=44249 RepID=A0A3P3TXT8_9BACL|nr:hypothetical protein [Paenibacillus oralis]RRJ62921.1 hypothetical protein EHV15_08230 [Paenibacillus oralis]
MDNEEKFKLIRRIIDQCKNYPACPHNLPSHHGLEELYKWRRSQVDMIWLGHFLGEFERKERVMGPYRKDQHVMS